MSPNKTWKRPVSPPGARRAQPRAAVSHPSGRLLLGHTQRASRSTERGSLNRAGVPHRGQGPCGHYACYTSQPVTARQGRGDPTPRRSLEESRRRDGKEDGGRQGRGEGGSCSVETALQSCKATSGRRWLVVTRARRRGRDERYRAAPLETATVAVCHHPNSNPVQLAHFPRSGSSSPKRPLAV